MLADHEAGDRVLALRPVATAADVLAAQDAATRVHASARSATTSSGCCGAPARIPASISARARGPG